MKIPVDTYQAPQDSRHWTLFPHDFLFTLDLIEQFVNVHNVETFGEDELAVRAVRENLSYISAIAKEVPTSIRWKFPEIPWAILRNLEIFISGKPKADTERMIWSLVHVKVLPLRTAISRMLEECQRNESSFAS